jgi:biofilm PGA synthesis N-glycosyltransferase PgaC
MNTATVTLYMPCWNGARYLRETIPAALNQQYPFARFLFINDGSSDESEAIARSYAGVTVISHEKNRGLSAARNTALAHTDTQYIAALDADTVAAPDWLAICMRTLHEMQVQGVGGFLQERHTATLPDQYRAEVMKQHHGPAAGKDLLIFGCNSLYHTETIRSLGGYNESLTTAFDDVDLHRRLLAAGYTTYYEPTARCEHLRKDTLQTVVDTAYRWRLPSYEAQEIFTSEQRLATKWTNEIRTTLKELQDCLSQDAPHWALPMLYGLLSSIVHDLELRAKRRGDDTTQKDYTVGFIAVLRAILLTKTYPDQLKQTLTDSLCRRFRAHHGASIEALQMCAKNASSLEEVYQFVDQRPTPLTPYIELCLWQLSLGIELQPALIEALIHGCKRIALEEKQ